MLLLSVACDVGRTVYYFAIDVLRYLGMDTAPRSVVASPTKDLLAWGRATEVNVGNIGNHGERYITVGDANEVDDGGCRTNVL